MILPTTFEPGQEATFTFRFLQQKHPKHHSLVFINMINVHHQYHYCALLWLDMDHKREWYRVLSHGQAKLKSVDSTPAIIKSAIVKVTILSENRAWAITTIFLRRPPPWQTPRALSNTTPSSCSSQTTEEPSMPLNCRSISINTTFLKSSLMVVTTSWALVPLLQSIIICAPTISSFLLITFITLMATGTLGDLPP